MRRLRAADGRRREPSPEELEDSELAVAFLDALVNDTAEPESYANEAVVSAAQFAGLGGIAGTIRPQLVHGVLCLLSGDVTTSCRVLIEATEDRPLGQIADVFSLPTTPKTSLDQPRRRSSGS